MIKISKHNQPSVEIAFYYVRLKTHDSDSLFKLEDSCEQAISSQSPAKIVSDELRQAGTNHKGITLEQWVLEPDSLHALVSLRPEQLKQGARSAKPAILTAFIAGLKAATAKRINLIRNEPGSPVWQRSYKEQLIEDDMMLFRLRKKLTDSPSVVRSS